MINVDVEEDKPPLKLGCNKEDDPWNVAQEFINKNCLSQVSESCTIPAVVQRSYCEQVQGDGS